MVKSKRCSWVQWFMPIIPATQETEIERILVQGQPRQKVLKTLSINKVGVVACACDPSYMGGLR
jgi:hypothetical protein